MIGNIHIYKTQEKISIVSEAAKLGSNVSAELTLFQPDSDSDYSFIFVFTFFRPHFASIK